MSDSHYNLRWPNHKESLLASFEDLLHSELLTDMTLVVEENLFVPCHKMVLAASSPSFHKIFQKHPDSHSMVSLGTSLKQMKALLEYMYTGQVQVQEAELKPLLEAAERLQIKGLTMIEDKVSEEADIQATSPPPTVNSSTATNPSSPPHPPLNDYYQKLMERHSLPPYMPPHFPLIPSFPISSYGQYYPEGLCPKKFSQANRSSPILRNVLHQAQDSPSFGQDLTPVGSSCIRSRSNSSADSERHSSVDGSHNEAAFYPKMKSPKSERKPTLYPTSETKNASGKPQKMDWKRYKQYSSQDLINAINAVKYEKMSALKASKIYCVPSRTLYDKIKRLSIPTIRNMKRESSNDRNNSSSACFPYGIGGNVNGDIYNRKFYGEAGANGAVSSESSPPMPTNTPSPRAADWQKPSAEDVARCDSRNDECEMAEDLSMNRNLERPALKQEPMENSALH